MVKLASAATSSWHPPATSRPTQWNQGLRVGALILAVVLAMAMAAILPQVTIMWLIITTLRNQSGLRAMAETAVVWSIFDWRPAIHKLIAYWRRQ